MEDESQTEHIADGLILGAHVFDIDHLGRHVAWSSTAHEEILLLIGELSQSKISNHAIPAAFLPEDQVLRFEISVHDLLRMHFLESQKDR